MLKVGITGGIGSGKSYISNLFSVNFGIPIYFSDYRAKFLMINDLTLRNQVIKNFGEDSYIDNNINKEKFNKLLFNDRNNLSLMNSLVVPVMEKDFNNFCYFYSMSPYVLKESAILLETDTYKNLDKIICVVADKDLRLKRVMDRDNMTEELFWKKFNNQTTDEKRIEISDYIIYNNNDDVEDEILKIHNFLLIYNNKKS